MTDGLHKLTECCICFQSFTDPRTLECFHTFCLVCLQQTAASAQKEPQENMPCPLCRTPFRIPQDGMGGLRKNFFMEHLMEVTTMLQHAGKPVVACNMCKALHEGVEDEATEATMWCLECREHFCDMCSKAHKLSKLSRDHNIVKIGCETEEDMKKMQLTRNCSVHNQQPLNFYCADCKKIVCVSCFVENHKTHDCKDVTTVQADFRKAIVLNALKISNCVEEILSIGRITEATQTEILLNLAETEKRILKRNLELKEMIDTQTNSLMEKLSRIKQEQIKEFINRKEEIDRNHVILKSFETYCTELRSKGSTSDICGCVDELIARSNQLEKDHKEFCDRPFQMTRVSFHSTELKELPSHQITNFVGRIECTVSFRDQSTSSETSDNDALGKREEKEEEKVDSLVLRPESQTLIGYKKLLLRIGLGRVTVDKGNDLSKLAAFSEREIAKLHSLDYLENVQRELGFSGATKRFKSIQATHTRMANVMLDLIKGGPCTSSDQLKRLTELQSFNSDLQTTIRFLIHCKNAERGLLPKGFENHELPSDFNAVTQCLLQTNLLSFELAFNLHDLRNVSPNFTMGEVFLELVARYDDNEQRKKALQILLCRFKETSQQLMNQRDFLFHFLHMLQVDERNARKIASARPNSHKILTAVDRVFGGQLITVYKCKSCEEPHATREPFVEISVSLGTMTPDEQKPEDKKSKPEFEKIGRPVEPDTGRTLGTSDAESQQRSPFDVGSDGDHLSCDLNSSSPSHTTDDSKKTSSTKEVIEDMLHPLTVDVSAESESNTGLWSRMFWTSNPTVCKYLKYVTRDVEIKDGFLCANCQTPGRHELKMTSVTKRTLISSPPAVLALQLRRFEHWSVGYVERDEMISYDELLDLGPFCSSGSQRVDPDEENVWYSLYAVVVHRQPLAGRSLYVAYVKQRNASARLDDRLREMFLQKSSAEKEKVPNADDLAALRKRKAVKDRTKAVRPNPIPGQWFCIWNNFVSPCGVKEVLEQRAYMLFYERISGSDEKGL